MQFRLVLQTGAGSRLFRIFAVAFAVASACSALMLAGMLWADALPVPHRYLLPVVPFVFGIASLMFLSETWKRRATDALLSDDGIEILGGKHAGRRLKWSEIDPDKTRVDEDESSRQNDQGVITYFQRLLLSTREGDLELGATFELQEQMSFAAVVESVRGRCKGQVTPPGDDGPPEVLRCTSCSAPIRPADADESLCWRCGTASPVPQSIRERTRKGLEHNQKQTQLSHRIERILTQPSARTANLWIAGAMTFACSAPLLALVLLPYAGSVIATVPLTFALADLVSTRRAAFRGLSLVFAARPGARQGAPLRCRSCGGGLPASDETVVSCLYCESPNLPSLAWERSSTLWQRASNELDTFVQQQRQNLSRAWFRAGFWLVVVLGALYLALH